MRRLFDAIGTVSLLCCASVAFSNEVQTGESFDSAYEPTHSVSGRVIILAVSGGVEYQDGNQWRTAQAGTDFYDRLTLRTLTNSYADLWVNDYTSVVRVSSESLAEVPHMRLAGSNTTTMVYVRSGGVSVIAGPLSSDSRYEIVTPHGLIEFGHGAGVVEVAVRLNSATNDSQGLSVNALAGAVNVLNISGTNTTVKAGQHWDDGQPLVKPIEQSALDKLKPAFVELEKESGRRFKP
ncbi:MAG TPA: hypothetical protein VFC44_17500 [Candidatus Saccharimonadales bacterium]|nr:hypothetical protein [Candidatus Saccharimonadales bacterium]